MYSSKLGAPLFCFAHVLGDRTRRTMKEELIHTMHGSSESVQQPVDKLWFKNRSGIPTPQPALGRKLNNRAKQSR